MTRQERAVRTRHALIRSAAELFERHGYVQARLTEISSGAGVSPGALHFHFENKAAVADAVEHAASRALHRASRHVLGSGASALQQLTDHTHVFARMIREDVVVRAGYRLNRDPARPSGPDLRQEWHSCVHGILARAADEGALRGAASRQAVAATVVAATTGLESLGKRNERWLSRGGLTRFWEVMLPAIAAPHALESVDPAGTESVVASAAPPPAHPPASPPASPPAPPGRKGSDRQAADNLP